MAELSMMTNEAPENGSFEIPFSLNWTPATIFWKLTDKSGDEINDRLAVALTPATSYTLLLEDEDLEVADRESILRIVTIFGTYDYAAIGVDGVTFSQQVGFNMNKLT